jgi:integrase-like protein
MDRHEDPAPTRGQPRLLDQVRDVIRRLHYSIRTEQTYVDWIRRFILFHGKRHPAEMGAPEVDALLTHLAVQGKVAASTQNQAVNAIVFLYRQVLKKDFGWLEGVERAKHAQDAVNEENRIARVTPLPQDLGRSRQPNPPDRFLAA